MASRPRASVRDSHSDGEEAEIRYPQLRNLRSSPFEDSTANSQPGPSNLPSPRTRNYIDDIVKQQNQKIDGFLQRLEQFFSHPQTPLSPRTPQPRRVQPEQDRQSQD
jgi:hypothetical protein